MTGTLLNHGCGLDEAAPPLGGATSGPGPGDEPAPALWGRARALHGMAAIAGERRCRRRYGIRLPLRFKIVRDGLVIAAGVGDTIDMSSKGIAFRCASIFKRRTRLEISVSWPVLLDGTCPLQLVVQGSVIRSELKSTVVRVTSHDFRTNAGGHCPSIPSSSAVSTPLQVKPLFRLATVLPELAEELCTLLLQQGQESFVKQVPGLLIYEKCRCRNDRCSTLHTLPRIEDAVRHPSNIFRLFPENGDILVHSVAGNITSIEIMDRPLVRAKLMALFS